MKKDLHFPTIVGLIVLLLAVAAGVYLSTNRVSLSSKASGDCKPQNVQITNLTHTSATISFITSSTCRANVDINNQTVSDLKLETLNTPDESVHLHYFEVKRLKEKTSYDFTLISGGTSYNENSYKFTTAAAPTSATPTSNLAWGKVFDTDGKTPANAIVYLNIPGAYPLSSIVTTNGNWSISLANSFNDQLTNWFVSPADATAEDIIVVAENSSTTQVTNNTSRNNPVPNIILGRNSLESTDVTDTSTSGIVATQPTVVNQKKVEILNPQNNDQLSTSRPDFFGTAPINSRVIIELHSAQVINSETVTDPTGTWHWSPSSALDPGSHTLTVKTQNPATGIWETVTRSFVVLAADSTSSLSFEASGSATTPSPTIAPTIVPTDTVAPTIRVARPSTTVKPPVTGNTTPTLIVVLLSCVFLLVSFKLLQ